MSLPQQARVVIIGGGVIGCSVAYHLARQGWTNIVLLERKRLTSGTTWHAAGLIAQLRATKNMTRLAKYSQELYGRLEAETGVATGFKRCGSITVALTEHRQEEILRQAAMARSFGVEAEPISPAEVKARYDHINIDGVLGGVYLPLDGQGDPANIALALARGARQAGAVVREGCAATRIAVDGRRATGVDWLDEAGQTGTIAADHVVNCGGMWGHGIGRMAGVNVPLHACEHFYIVTDSIPGLTQMPVLRVPDECAYYKEDAGKMLLGAFEPVAKPWRLDIPDTFEFDQLPEDFDHFEPILERAVARMPMLADAGIHTFFNGPESFTPDDAYHLGLAPELDNFWVAVGFNSIGIQSAGGAGMALGPVDGCGGKAVRSGRCGHRADAAVPGQPDLPARTVAGNAGSAVCRPLPVPAKGHRAGGAPVAAASPSGAGRGRHGGIGRMGTRQLDRGCGAGRGLCLFVEAADVLRQRRPRTCRRADGRGAVRHVVLRKDPGGGAGRRSVPEPCLRRRP